LEYHDVADFITDSPDLTEAQHNWASTFTGVSTRTPAVVPGGAPGGARGVAQGGAPGGGEGADAGAAAKGGTAPKVRVFGEKAKTLELMGAFDRFHRHGEAGVTIEGKQYGAHEARRIITATEKEITRALDTVTRMNAGVWRENEIIRDVKDRASAIGECQESGKELSAAAAALNGKAYVKCYLALLGALNSTMRARAIIGEYNQKMIAEADRAVAALEIVRDVSFLLAGALAAPAGLSAGATLAVAAGTAVIGDLSKGVSEHKSLGEITLDVFLDVCLTRFAAKMKKPCAEGMRPWLKPFLDGHLTKLATWPWFETFRKTVLTHQELATLEKFAAMPNKATLPTKELRELITKAEIYAINGNLTDRIADLIASGGKQFFQALFKSLYTGIFGDKHLTVGEALGKFQESLESGKWASEEASKMTLGSLFERAAVARK
jgi:hypothetical protein